MILQNHALLWKSEREWLIEVLTISKKAKSEYNLDLYSSVKPARFFCDFTIACCFSAVSMAFCNEWDFHEIN